MSKRVRSPLLWLLNPFGLAMRWADDPGAGGGTAASDPAKPAALTQADIDEAVQAATAKENQKWAEQFKAVTGHDSLDAYKEAKAKQKGEEGKLIDDLKGQNATLAAQLNSMRIDSELRAASGEAIDPDVIAAMLAGKASVKDGVVTIDGKSPKDAVAALLKDRPHLAKPSGNQGGGTPQGGGAAAKQMARADFEKLDPDARMKFVTGGGKVV